MLAIASYRLRARPRLPTATLALAAAIGAAVLLPSPAQAFNPLKPICKVAKLGSGVAGKVCSVVSSPGKLLSAGGKLLTGHIGGAIHALVGGASPTAATTVGLAAVGLWVLGGAKFALHETATVLGHTTSPQLGSTWFSAVYGRMGAIAALLTLPFLFAAAVQALVRSDLALLSRAAFGYLPLALLAVAIAAPLTMLLLAACDQLSALVGAAAGKASTHFLDWAGTGVILSFFKGAPFLAFLVGLLAAAGALVLWIELLIREAAVYIVVMMLPLAFAAMVWPARRIWAVRAVEVLIALILAKFAIVAVLALGGSALGHTSDGITGALAGLVLVVLGAFAPWALLRLLPLTEIGSAAAGSIRAQARVPIGVSPESQLLTGSPAAWARSLTSAMSQQAADVPSDPPPSEADAGAQSETARLQDLERVPACAGTRALGTGPALEASKGSLGAGEGSHPPAPADGPADAGPGAGSTGAGSDPIDAGTARASEAGGERSPGMSGRWQAPDGSWRTLTLNLQEWPPPPLWEPADAPAGERHDGGPATRGAEAGAGGAEDHDPRPPRQAADDGLL